MSSSARSHGSARQISDGLCDYEDLSPDKKRQKRGKERGGGGEEKKRGEREEEKRKHGGAGERRMRDSCASSKAGRALILNPG